MAAYRHLGNGIYVGLTTDTKPTAANTANGAIAIEWATNYATFILYVNNQTTWLPATEFSETIKNKTLDSTNTISSATSLPTVTVAKGGTGAATATLGFDALSPMSAVGDLIVGSTAGTRIRLAIGSANQPLKVNSGGTDLDYGTLPVAGGGTGAVTLTGILKGNGTSAVTALTDPLPIANGGTSGATATAAFDALSGLTTAGDIIIGGASGTRSKLGIGTANQLLRTNSGATAPEWASTLSGLTLTSPTINGATLATSTIDAASNTLQQIPQHPGIKRTGSWQGGAATTGAHGILQGNLTNIATGSATNAGVQRSSAGLRFRFGTGATGASLCGNRSSGGAGFFERDLNPMFQAKISLQQTTTQRMTIGFVGSTSNPTAGADPLANLSGVCFFYDSTVGSNWAIAQNSGGASSDRTTIANAGAADTNAHVFAIRADNANTKFQYYYGTTVPTSATVWTDINTVIPAAATGLMIMHFQENIGSNAVTHEGYWTYIEQDP